ncbi:hypothetical protein NJBCHELONAE_13300 [Mycobacteroides chelonae]|nr:hypothetical protein NJBCHELONAE_13300 [Mycobacteroides chelonae]
MRWRARGQIMETDQPGDVEGAVIHAAAFGAPRYLRQQLTHEIVGTSKPFMVYLKPSAACQLAARDRWGAEQGCLHSVWRGCHTFMVSHTCSIARQASVFS